MKKSTIIISAAAAFCQLVPSAFCQTDLESLPPPEPEKTQKLSWTDRLVMYIPNRILDLTDVFSLEFALGYDAACAVFLTDACSVGGSIGVMTGAGKDFNRQLGSFSRQGWYVSFLTLNAQNWYQDYTTLSMQPFWLTTRGFPVPSQGVYQEKIRDYYAIGFDLGFLINVNFRIHPAALYDFLAGLFFFDPADDDLVLTPAKPEL